MIVELDFSEIQDLERMHLLLKKKFGFPDFYGKNVNALIEYATALSLSGHYEKAVQYFKYKF